MDKAEQDVETKMLTDDIPFFVQQYSGMDMRDE